ncbi:MAG TPA: type II secretion system F family protein [Caldithrix abyssi]|uniref:Type II secretion system F family protein n=1 Tax=Caldithrix abyssi TaxID=187145 RepID=A0A7V4U0U3_CALAY|nr:type II secretion system F family protein [Caldithrix abyssi]
MPNFKYKAISTDGKQIESVLLAADKNDVMRQLKELGMTVIAVNEMKSAKSTDPLRISVKENVVIHFTKQLHTLLKAGLPIITSLRAIRQQATDEGFKDVIESVTRDIEQGSKLSDALGRYPKIFPQIFISSIKIGEVSGTLEETLLYLYRFLERDSRIRRDVKKAFRYPIFVFTGLLGAFVVFTTMVIPNFIPMFEARGVELPLPTKILMGMYYLITDYGILLLLFIVALGAGIYFYARTPAGRYKIDSLLLQIPIMGMFIRKVNLARFSQLFYTMNRTGIAITQTFEIMQRTMENEVYNKELGIIADKITKGEEIAKSLQQSPVFTPLMVEMVSIGEKSGSLDEMLANVAEYYNQEVSDTVANLTSLIEPIITVGLGGMILLLALALFLPMWDMMNIM